MSNDTLMCLSCGVAWFDCPCEFHPEILLPDGQEKCPTCRAPHDRCVCAPFQSAELSLSIERTGGTAPTLVVSGSVLTELDLQVLMKLLDHELSTTQIKLENDTISIRDVEKGAIADYFRTLGYSITDSADGQTSNEKTSSTGETALYTPDEKKSTHSIADRSTAEASDSATDESTSTFSPPECPSCNRTFSERDEPPTYCPACGRKL